VHVLCVGAHPDDCESSMGGTAALFAARNDVVRFLSVTNGDKGHFREDYIRSPATLAERRRHEALAASARLGCSYRCLGVHDGEVYVTKETTEAMIRAIRGFGPTGIGPDLILTNRPCDYHRDHRYTAQIVLDALYMLTVPPACPDTPHLRRLPVVAYWQDGFTESGAFRADVAVCIDAAMEQKVSAVLAHESQFLEWIPYNAGSHEAFASFPEDREAQRERIARLYRQRAEEIARRYSEVLPAGARHAEAFQISDYGDTPSADEIRGLFPVSPSLSSSL